MGYQHGIYISSVFSLGTEPPERYSRDSRPSCVAQDPKECACRGRLSPKMAFVCMTKRFAESLLLVITHTKGALPPVRWYTYSGKRLPDDAADLIEAIIVERVGKVVVENLGHRNAYTGRTIDLSEYWEFWSASAVGPKTKLWIAKAVARGVVERERRRVELEAKRRRSRKSDVAK